MVKFAALLSISFGRQRSEAGAAGDSATGMVRRAGQSDLAERFSLTM